MRTTLPPKATITQSQVETFAAFLTRMWNEYWAANYSNLVAPSAVIGYGSKFAAIYQGTSRIYAFVALYDGEHKGQPVKAGDIMMPASFRSAAKHSRGNILTDTSCCHAHGVSYLK